MKRFKFILILLVILSCRYSYSQESELSILFVGNSLTYTNALPKLVEKATKKQGLNIQTEMIAKPDYALIDHWNDGKVQKLISTKKFDLVIVQQGPSSRDFGKEILIEYGEKFKKLCEENNADLAFFMVWPSRQFYHTFDGVIENHTEAAKIKNALLFPVGEVWKKHFEATKNFDYYGPDQFHPSEKGSLAAAEIIASELLKWKRN